MAFAEIEEKLGIEMPRFYYRPQGLEFLKYDIDESVAIARVEYEYKTGMIITLLVDRQDENTASKTNSAHGPNVETVEMNVNGVRVMIEGVRNDQDEESSFTAQWEMENVLYHLSGKIELEELKKIIDNMVY